MDQSGVSLSSGGIDCVPVIEVQKSGLIIVIASKHREFAPQPVVRGWLAETSQIAAVRLRHAKNYSKRDG
jgi:hypothetical protein